MPTVSVVIPAYNCESFIAETLSSILNQTYKDIEIIVIDDGSTDRTTQIAASFGDTVRVVQKPNAGVCKARNAGIAEARGEFICLMDHDDYWFPEKLERQLGEMERHPEAGGVYSEFILWYPNSPDGAFPNPESFDLSSYPDDTDPEYSGWIYHQFLMDCWILTSTAMFRREVFAACGVFDESLPYSEDWELWIRISHEYPLIKLTRPTTLYRQHPGQGNRLIREKDYRTSLILESAKKWGLCSRDGRCVPRADFARNLALYHAMYALEHVKADHKWIAVQSFLKAWTTYPSRLKYLAYIPATFLGWKPSS